MINVYLVKAAAIFMVTTSTISIYTHLTPRWLAIGGYFIAFVLLWVFLVGLSILWHDGLPSP